MASSESAPGAYEVSLQDQDSNKSVFFYIVCKAYLYIS